MTGKVERIEIAPGFTISRVLTGLWQIADMEKDGSRLDPIKTAPAMQPYFDAGLTTFDMADHYGSAEIIAGTYQKSLPDPNEVQLFTKWVPKPGPVTRDEVREAVQISLDRMQAQSLDLLQFHSCKVPNLLFAANEIQKDAIARPSLMIEMKATCFRRDLNALV